jgi:hypothetical protein
MLGLAEVEERDDGCLFVLWGVASNDCPNPPFIFGVEFEGNGGIVCRSVSMLFI